MPPSSPPAPETAEPAPPFSPPAPETAELPLEPVPALELAPPSLASPPAPTDWSE
jgi:hypothetical protein